MSQDDDGDGGLGTPPVAYGQPFDAPWLPGEQPSTPPARRRLPRLAIGVPVLIVAFVVVTVAIPTYLHKPNTPVMPAQLSGLRTSTDTAMRKVVAAMRNQLAASNEVVQTRVAGYGTVSSGYVLIGFNAHVNVNKEFSDMGATISPLAIGAEFCAPSATRNVSMCIRSSPRGAVAVVAFNAIDLNRLAAIGDEAWSDQPFGD